MIIQSKVLQAEKGFVDRIKGDVARQTQNHVVTSETFGPVRVYKFAKPGTVVYSMRIVCCHGRMFTFGDMGAFIWEREEPMENWFRFGDRNPDLDYLASKVPQNIETREERLDWKDLWLEDAKAQYIEDNGVYIDDGTDTPKPNFEALALDVDYQALIDIGKRSFECLRDFQSSIYESSYCCDFEDVPDLRFFSHRFIWQVFAINSVLTELNAKSLVGAK